MPSTTLIVDPSVVKPKKSHILENDLEPLTDIFLKSPPVAKHFRILAPVTKHTHRKQAVLLQSSGANQKAHHFSRGLVSAFVRAYNEHYDLVLRPDDFWTAIITQFGYYMRRNSEELRRRIVSHEDQIELAVEVPQANVFEADYRDVVHQIVTENMTSHLKDPSVAEWLLPKFSTTTATDHVVSCISIMSSMVGYFQYSALGKCGLPSVTLLGEEADWELLRKKVDRFLEFDNKVNHMKQWHEELTVVLDEVVKTGKGAQNVEFWKNMVSYNRRSGAPATVSGWATVFTRFCASGILSAPFGKQEGDRPYPTYNFTDCAPGILMAPLTLKQPDGTEYNSYLFAGHFSYEFDHEKVQLKPRTDWCIVFSDGMFDNEDAGPPSEGEDEHTAKKRRWAGSRLANR